MPSLRTKHPSPERHTRIIHSPVKSRPKPWSEMLLKLTVLEASDLSKADFHSNSDPYVVLRIGGMQRCTTVKQNTRHPEWNESFYFTLGAEDTKELEVWVYDKDTINSDFIGSCKVNLYEMGLGSETKNTWASLVNGRRSGGKIHLRFETEKPSKPQTNLTRKIASPVPPLEVEEDKASIRHLSPPLETPNSSMNADTSSLPPSRNASPTIHMVIPPSPSASSVASSSFSPSVAKRLEETRARDWADVARRQLELIDTLRKELASRTERSQSAIEVELRNRLATLERERDSLKIQMSHMLDRKKATQLMHELEEAKAKAREVVQLEERARVVGNEETLLSKMELAIIERDQSLSELQQQQIHHRQQLAEKNLEVTELRSERDALNERCERLARRLYLLEDAMKRKDKEVADMVDSVRKEVKRPSFDYSSIERRNSEDRGLKEHFENERRSMLQEISYAKTQIQQLKEDKSTLEKQVRNLENNRSELSTAKVRLNERNTQLTNEVSQLKTEIATLEDKLATVEQERELEKTANHQFASPSFASLARMSYRDLPESSFVNTTAAVHSSYTQIPRL